MEKFFYNWEAFYRAQMNDLNLVVLEKMELQLEERN